jgi:hypothetical protein
MFSGQLASCSVVSCPVRWCHLLSGCLFSSQLAMFSAVSCLSEVTCSVVGWPVVQLSVGVVQWWSVNQLISWSVVSGQWSVGSCSVVSW